MPISERYLNPQDNPGYNVVSVIRSCYGKEVMNLSRKRDGRGFNAVNNLYINYLKDAVKPDLAHVKEQPGDFFELLDGVSHFMTHRLITDKLSSLSDGLLKSSQESEPLVVTDDLPNYTLRLRELFPPEDDVQIQRASIKGLIQGWSTLLDLIDTDEVPLMLYPPELKGALQKKSMEQTGGQIVLPTTVPGVTAQYEYSNVFPLPSISLNLNCK